MVSGRRNRRWSAEVVTVYCMELELTRCAEQSQGCLCAECEVLYTNEHGSQGRRGKA